jgi:dTDP-4-dehydrorhamnose 3,5-epimerase
MNFIETELGGAFVVEPERHEDERGFFARIWCRREFEERGLDADLAQCNISYNREKGTLRGMHYQHPPFAETKLVRCARGAVHDVIIDLRPGSPTFGRWLAAELTATNNRLLYIPRGFAHGFQTLEDDTEVAYQVSEFYHPEVAGCVRWDDPAFRISWPLDVTVIAPRDRDCPDFRLPEPGSKGGAA